MREARRQSPWLVGAYDEEAAAVRRQPQLPAEALHALGG